MSDDLEARIRQSAADYAALSPLDRAIHDAAQRRSFVRGQMGHDPGPDVLVEEIAALRASLAAAKEEAGRLRSALTEIARLRTELSGDFSMGSRQSDIARKALKQ